MKVILDDINNVKQYATSLGLDILRMIVKPVDLNIRILISVFDLFLEISVVSINAVLVFRRFVIRYFLKLFANFSCAIAMLDTHNVPLGE